MATLETLVRHASDWIDWIDRSGFAASSHVPRVSSPIQVRLLQAPSDLSLFHKRGQSILWRRQSVLQYIVKGAASETQRARPVETPYDVVGEVEDVLGIYLPRRFTLLAGNGVGHALDLYRTPRATVFHSAGGLQGRVVFQNGIVASWAIVNVTVSPPVGEALSFTAQAGEDGEFVLPLNSLPALTKDALQPDYAAVLRIRASAVVNKTDSPDPDQFPPAQVFSPRAAAEGFLTDAPFRISPGLIAPLTSKDMDHLQIHP